MVGECSCKELVEPGLGRPGRTPKILVQTKNQLDELIIPMLMGSKCMLISWTNV